MMSRGTFSVAFLWIVAALLQSSQPGSAAALALDCNSECRATLAGWMSAEQSRRFPIFAKDAERFEAEKIEAKCDRVDDATPSIHAIVVAPFFNKRQLPGTQNDAGLWRKLFQDRGVRASNLHVVDGNTANREAILEAMRKVVPCVRERDQVVFTFSGVATSYSKLGQPTVGGFLSRVCVDEATSPDARRRICERTAEKALAVAFSDLLVQFSEHILISSDTELSVNFDIYRDELTGIRSTELSNFGVQIRNRNADVIFVLDTDYAEGFRLLEAQERAAFDSTWRQVGRAEEKQPETDGVYLYGSGGMAALYATRADEYSREAKRTGDIVLGELTFAVSEALRTLSTPTIEQLASEVSRTIAEETYNQVPVFEATDKSLRFLATREEPQAHPERIEMINPRVMRGAVAVNDPEVQIVARYDGPAPAAFASIDGVNVEVDVNGQFRRPVKLQGRNEVPIRVYGRDATVLAEKRLLFGANEVEASLAPVGRRLALIIANQNYADPSFSTLSTPLADGKAVAQALQKFGFTTTLQMAPGKERELFLVDASKSEIQKAFFDVRKSLTTEDQLVIFYAGHGQVDSENTAYWVPADGRATEDFTWIRAFEITEDVRKFAAGSVLLISDSCYAGGLTRDSISNPQGARDRYLAKATRYKARHLIASGGDEPVQDGGGGGHSLFARALLEGLSEMPEKVFTASELFNNKIKPKTIEYAFATTSKGQTPVFHRMTHAGDEPESEFVFVRNEK